MSSILKIFPFTNNDTLKESTSQTIGKLNDKISKASPLSKSTSVTTVPKQQTNETQKDISQEKYNFQNKSLTTSTLDTNLTKEKLHQTTNSQTSPRRESNRNYSTRRESEVTDVEQIMKEENLVAEIQRQIAQSNETETNSRLNISFLLFSLNCYDKI